MTARILWLPLAFLTFLAVEAQAIESGTEKSPETGHLEAGDYVWQPEASPVGPLVIIVDLSKQVLNVYRNGVKIGRSTISSGKEDHQTPTGLFTILQKNVTHHSSIYHEASMPYMERLTWDGVAIHAGNLPGYPESHGCVHVPMKFAKKLYDITTTGTTVLVTDGAASGSPPAKTDLVFSNAQNAQPLPPPSPQTPNFSWNPQASPDGSLCVVFSSADKKIYVYRNGVEIGQAVVTESQEVQSAGDRIFAADAQTTAEGNHQWKQLGSLDATTAPNLVDLFKQLIIPPAFLQDLRQTITPGTTLVITDQRVDQSPPKGAGGDLLDTAGE